MLYFRFVSGRLKRIKSEGKVSAYRKHVRWRMYGHRAGGIASRGVRTDQKVCVVSVYIYIYVCDVCCLYSEVDVNVSIKVRLRRGRDSKWGPYFSLFLFSC